LLPGTGVDGELVSLGFAAKDRVVFEHQGFCLWRFLLKVQGGGQTAQAPSDDGNVEDLARILRRLWRIGEEVVTNLVAGPHHFKGVSIRFGVIARAAVTGEALFAQLG
jgi:hypothetical protein